MSIFALADTLKSARATFRDWGEYKRETGQWPLVSIAVHLANLVALASITIWLISFSWKHNWSSARFVWTLILVLLPYFLLWCWIEDKVKLNEIRNRRRLASSKLNSPKAKIAR